jgi:diguanylate cyclase (GGDEF)-like protein
VTPTDRMQADRFLAPLELATFAWDLATDALDWGEGAAALFQNLPVEALASGASLARLMEPTKTIRADAIANAAANGQGGAGGSYQIEYGLRAKTSDPITWVEEWGRCLAGSDGKPARVEGVVRVISERHARDEQLMKLSHQDPLTGELNRTHLIAALAAALEEAARFRSSFAFILLGIDHFARLNDSFGFDIADAVIQEVAKRVRARLRGGDVLGRFSGNKLGIIVKNCSGDDINVATERFLLGIREEVVATASGPVSVTASIGAVSAPRHARTTDDAINRAQEALDAAKARRRGSALAWQPSIERETQRRVNIRVTDEIVTALNDRRVIIAFEPVVGTLSRQPAFYESLVRMRVDGSSILAPDIVPVAEKLGLIRLVDHRVLELVLDELVKSRQVELSLNISPNTTTDPEWWGSMDAAMRAYPSIGPRLIVEITETAAIQNLEDVQGFVTRLKNHGCRIAIDDFGAGYTSFRNLRKLGVDIVKIDGAFVQNVVRSADDRAFVQTLIDLARRLSLQTVAEWVQDDESAKLLQDWGCDFIQGRFIGLASEDRPWVSAASKVAG